MPARTRENKRVVVIGTSAGGLSALRSLVSQLPADFMAAIFIVQHMSPSSSGDILVRALQNSARLRCKLAEDQQTFGKGDVLVAPPDHHLLLKKGHVLVTKGARENRSRPAVDSLFRSAAVAYGRQAIGILLTGNLDDGTAGMAAIQNCGGICIVQDPASADYPDMPRSALQNVRIDHCVPLSEMGALLQNLLSRPQGKGNSPPENTVLEAKIAERVLSDIHGVSRIGDQVPYNCPNCGGVLWQIAKSKEHRYRCHTGHSFTASSLEASQLERIEETLWICLRMLEERRNLLNATARREQTKGFSKVASLQRQRATETGDHIDRIREMLRTSTGTMSSGIPPKH
jgi:two-component system chemotaxis response regulator CheB